MESPRAAGGLSRALGMLFRPRGTWDMVAAEPADGRSLMLRYAAPLAAIPAVCSVVGALVFGFNIANIGVHMSLIGLILAALAGYGLTLAAVWVLAAFIDLTAPAFGGARGREAALNLAVYAATASWVGGIAELYPSVGIPVGILAGIYSLYALYLGLPKLMRIPDAQRLPAFAAVLIAILLLGAARGMVTAKAAELGGPLSASYAPR
jgi:hypothetical protein